MSVLSGGRFERVKNKGLTVKFPLDIYNIHKDLAACLSPASVLHQYRAIYIEIVSVCTGKKIMLHIAYYISLILPSQFMKSTASQTRNTLGLFIVLYCF